MHGFTNCNIKMNEIGYVREALHVCAGGMFNVGDGLCRKQFK